MSATSSSSISAKEPSELDLDDDHAQRRWWTAHLHLLNFERLVAWSIGSRYPVATPPHVSLPRLHLSAFFSDHLLPPSLP